MHAGQSVELADTNICVLGLGYVGLTLAVTLADIGFSVHGVEIREEVLEKLAAGQAHFYEPGLDERLQRVVQNGQFTFGATIGDNWRGTVYIITVGTPLGPDGKARLDMIRNVAHEVASVLRDGDLVVLRSTVKLGVTRNVVKPILDGAAKSYDLAFCPERTLEGNALNELRQLPQIVGGVTHRAAVRASQLFQFVTPTVVRVSDAETAEMIKLVDNAHRDVMFAYANEVARACDAAGVSAAEVIRAGKLGYPRTNLPMPGLVGGPCLEKDPYILAEGLEERGYAPPLTVAARRLNERLPSEVVRELATRLEKVPGFPKAPTVCMLGIAFKGRPPTDDLRGTMARPVLEALRAAFPRGRFRGFDAVVPRSCVEAFGLEPADTLEEAFAGAHLVVITNNHPAFAAMSVGTLAGAMARPGVVYDFWNNFDAHALRLPESVAYLALGSHGKGVWPWRESG